MNRFLSITKLRTDSHRSTKGEQSEAGLGKLWTFLERETGIEPATFSLGKRLQIENKEHSEFRHLFQAIEFRQNSQFPVARLLMEFNWCSLGHWQHTRPPCRWWPSISDPAIGRSSRIRACITEPDSRTNGRFRGFIPPLRRIRQPPAGFDRISAGARSLDDSSVR